MTTIRVGVIGAGAIGCFVSALLANATRCQVTLLARSRQLLQLKQQGVQAVWQKGQTPQLFIPVSCEMADLACMDVLVLCVKATALNETCAQIAAHIPNTVPVLLLQNGIGIKELVSSKLQNPLWRGLVPFNVVQTAPSHYTQTSGGVLCLQTQNSVLFDPIVQAFAQGPSVQCMSDIQAVEYGKLLLNLNNALNALANVPLKTQLQQRAWRKILAAAMREWLAVCEATQVTPMKMTALPPRWLPNALELPDWLFRKLAASMLRIDPQARLSMWFDVSQHKETEIDFLNGAVVDIATALGLAAPVNRWITTQIKQLHYDENQLPSAEALCLELGL